MGIFTIKFIISTYYNFGTGIAKALANVMGKKCPALTGGAAQTVLQGRHERHRYGGLNMKALYSPTLNLVGKVMDLQLKRQNVVMSNVANVRTPNYKRRTLDFEEEIQSALQLDARGRLSRTNEGHMPSTFDPNSFEGDWDKKFVPRQAHGEDRVDLDKEMALMAKTSMQYNALSTIIRGNFEGIKNIITEGSK